MKKPMSDKFEEKLAFDENGNIKSWKIVYCGWLTDTMLLNEKAPYQHAYVSAHTAKEAVQFLKEDLRLKKIHVVGEPQFELITKEEYENN